MDTILQKIKYKVQASERISEEECLQLYASNSSHRPWRDPQFGPREEQRLEDLLQHQPPSQLFECLLCGL